MMNDDINSATLILWKDVLVFNLVIHVFINQGTWLQQIKKATPPIAAPILQRCTGR